MSTNILRKLPTELVLSSLAWLDCPRDLARCRSASRALRDLIDSHTLSLLSSVLRRSPAHAACPSPLPASVSALMEMHLLRARSGPIPAPSIASLIVTSSSSLAVAPDSQGNPSHNHLQTRFPHVADTCQLDAPTTFVACSSRSYTDTVQIPGTPVLLCSTRHATSPLAAVHLESLRPRSSCAPAASTNDYKVAIALPVPAQDAHTELVGAMCAHPAGRPLVATGSIDGTVKLWTATRASEQPSFKGSTASVWTVTCLATFRHHRGWAAAVSMSKDLLVSSGPDNEIHVYRLPSDANLLTLSWTAAEPDVRIRVPIPTDTPFGIFGASISPSGKHLVVMDLDGVAYLYRATNKTQFELQGELSERLTLREARHFEANVRQSFGCLVQATDHCVFVNSVHVGEVKVYDVWTGQVLYTLSIPTFNPPRSRTVHSFRFVSPAPSSTPSRAFGASSRGFFGLLVTTCAGDLHCFDYANTPSAWPTHAPARWRIAPAIVTAPATTPVDLSASVGVQDDEFADMPPLLSPTHLEDSHEFDFGSPSSSPTGTSHKENGAGNGDVNDQAAGASTSDQRRRLVVSPHGLRDPEWRQVHVDVDESVAAHVWGLAI